MLCSAEALTIEWVFFVCWNVDRAGYPFVGVRLAQANHLPFSSRCWSVTLEQRTLMKRGFHQPGLTNHIVVGSSTVIDLWLDRAKRENEYEVRYGNSSPPLDRTIDQVE